MNPFKAVDKFNKTVVKIADRELQSLPQSEAEWLVGAVEEEVVEELGLAIRTDDIVGQVDAVTDAIYFLMGAYRRMGLTPKQAEECFKAVHEANIEKISGCKEERKVTINKDAVKPKEWVTPEARIRRILYPECF